MADPKGKPGLALIFKGAGGRPPPGDEPDGDEGEEAGPTEEYRQAYREYEDDPSDETFWRAVKACVKGGY